MNAIREECVKGRDGFFEGGNDSVETGENYNNTYLCPNPNKSVLIKVPLSNKTHTSSLYRQRLLCIMHWYVSYVYYYTQIFCAASHRHRHVYGIATSVLIWNITVTSKWAQWRLKSPISPLFTKPFIQAQIKENIKAPRHWPLYVEFTGDRWIQRTNGQQRRKCFHWMTLSW